MPMTMTLMWPIVSVIGPEKMRKGSEVNIPTVTCYLSVEKVEENNTDSDNKKQDQTGLDRSARSTLDFGANTVERYT